ncbi:hypothetical protein [Pseudoroseomonas ludipueritiae]|uniref:Uncharacterized protein n=1 Tax=Pseudoroseomonas ludipueritiae TaxID=198093 RepID=A0ABR7R3J3_9PROT|nr:hypothetical protein [Pseudoroseomonas ludipueritiae]MBC9176319.1 hypothetical protein [Pseudoroseomonas ludipueritiae]
MRAYDRVRGGRPELVGSHTRTAPDGSADDRAIGFGGGGSTGRAAAGGSVIFVMRRRDPLEGVEKPQPLEGGSGGMSAHHAALVAVHLAVRARQNPVVSRASISIATCKRAICLEPKSIPDAVLFMPIQMH